MSECLSIKVQTVPSHTQVHTHTHIVPLSPSLSLSHTHTHTVVSLPVLSHTRTNKPSLTCGGCEEQKTNIIFPFSFTQMYTPWFIFQQVLRPLSKLTSFDRAQICETSDS